MRLSYIYSRLIAILQKLHDHARVIGAGKHVGDVTVSIAIDKQVDISLVVKHAPVQWGNDVTLTYKEVGQSQILLQKCQIIDRSTLLWRNYLYM